MNRDADRILAEVLSGADDTAANDLLEQFFSGYPIEHLRDLFQSENEAAAKAGAWIASELGSEIAPLISDVANLLGHRSRYVRFFAVDGILAAAGPEHGKEVATVVEAIGDEDDAVRWKVMNFLARASVEQLEASIPYVKSGILAVLTAWLVDAHRRGDLEAVLAQIDKDEKRLRRFGAAAAARLAPRELRALEHASASSDQEVASFAQEWLNR